MPLPTDSGILPEAVRGLVAHEREVLGRLRELLAGETSASDDVRQLRQAELDLDELFLLVVVGEFNAGKSAFINALLGARVLREGVTPTTAVITRLRYAPSPGERREGPLLEVGYPLDLLRDVAVVDTPGTNAIVREHEEITSHFVPRADLVLFVTSADRPFTETERAFMERIRTWGKKVVVVLNKVDLLGAGPGGRTDGVRAPGRRTLARLPPGGVSRVGAAGAGGQGRDADPRRRATAWSDEPLPERSRTTSAATLDERGRLLLKLSTPLGIAERIARNLRDGGRRKAGPAGRRPGAGGVHRHCSSASTAKTCSATSRIASAKSTTSCTR